MRDDRYYDRDSGIQNMGAYRGHLKGATRLGMMILANARCPRRNSWKTLGPCGNVSPATNPIAGRKSGVVPNTPARIVEDKDNG